MNAKRVLVTGGTGFIGSFLVEKLLERNYHVTIFDNIPLESAVNLRNFSSSPNLEYFEGDIRDKDDVFNIVNRVFDQIYHLAALVGIKYYLENPLGVIDVNVIGTKNILEAAISHNTPVLLTSTSEIYGVNPNIPWKEDAERVLGPTSVDRWSYSSSKAICEHMAYALHQTKNLPIKIVRYFNVYGPRQNPVLVVSQNVKRVAEGKSPILYDGGQQTRSFTFVKDAVEATILVTEDDSCNGEAFNVGSTFEYKIKDLLIELCNIGNIEPNFKPFDTKVEYGEKYQDIIRRVPDVSKIKKFIGWKATTTVNQGLTATLNWAKEEFKDK